MRIATVNVNGIRAAARKGMGEWITANTPDVLLLQEVRAPQEIASELVPGYEVFQSVSELKGRAGVLVGVRPGLEVSEVRVGIGVSEPAVDTGRWVEVDIPELETTFVAAYLHSGVATSDEKMAAKYSHLERITTRMSQLLSEPTQKHVLIGGDLNIAHTPLDIKNWKPNHNKTAGVLDAEIAYLDRWFEMGYVDAHRAFVGPVQGPYTWWSQRGKAFDNDAGWRIDYQLTDSALASRVVNARVDRAGAYDLRWSDHAPLVLEYR